MDRHDVRMVELPRRPRLALETAQAVLVLRERFGEHLHRDVPLEPRVPGAVHLAHPARAEQRLDLVWAQACAGGNGMGHHSRVPFAGAGGAIKALTPACEIVSAANVNVPFSFTSRAARRKAPKATRAKVPPTLIRFAPAAASSSSE